VTDRRVLAELAAALVAVFGSVLSWQASRSTVTVAPVAEGVESIESVRYYAPLLALSLLLATVAGVLLVLAVTRIAGADARAGPPPPGRCSEPAHTRLVQSSEFVTLLRMTELAQESAGVRDDALPLGPDSLVWRYFGDNRMFLIGPRPAVLQNMLADLGQGVLDHSVFFKDTAARVRRSLPPIFMTVYGTDEDNAGLQVRDYHHRIKGTMPDGRRYHALDPETYFWAHATFVDQVLYFADTFVKRLTPEEKERIYLESKTWYRRYGVSDRPMPATYAEFERYWDRMLSEVLVAHKTAKYGVGYVTKGFPCPKAVHPAVWRVVSVVFNPVAAFLTTGGLPPRARELLGLPWSERQERRYQRFAAFWRSRPVNWLWNRLPMSVRYNKFARKGFAHYGRTA